MSKSFSNLSVEKRLEEISIPENQGGDLSMRDYSWYGLLGIALPALLLIWGWS